MGLLNPMNKGSFIMLVGIPGSGKSTFAETLNGIVLSSDLIRKEVYGNEEEQKNPQMIFDIMNKRTVEHLKSGQTVIYDATNISTYYRKRNLEFFKKYSSQVICYFIDTPLEIAIERNNKRSRVVDINALYKMYNNLEFPKLGEGFDKIIIVDENFIIKEEIFT